MKNINGFPDYLAGEDGRIYSIFSSKPKQLAEFRHPYSNYLSVYLKSKNSRNGYYIHNLIALAFYNKSHLDYTIIHKDGNTFNNQPGNLGFKKIPASEKEQKAYLAGKKDGNELRNIVEELEADLLKRIDHDRTNKVWQRYIKLKESSGFKVLHNWLKIYTDMDFNPDSIKSAIVLKNDYRLVSNK